MEDGTREHPIARKTSAIKFVGMGLYGLAAVIAALFVVATGLRLMFGGTLPWNDGEPGLWDRLAGVVATAAAIALYIPVVRKSWLRKTALAEHRPEPRAVLRVAWIGLHLCGGVWIAWILVRNVILFVGELS